MRRNRSESRAQIEYVSLGDLRPWPRNSRVHSKKQIKQLVQSMRRFGFTIPVLIDERNTILAGHARANAAEALGMKTIPCLRNEGMSPEEKRAYVIADNKLTLNAAWDDDLLAEELKALTEVEIDFDIGLTGFSVAEIETLIDGLAPEDTGNPVDDRLPDEAPVRCKRGDIWQLGPHRLICGDARDPQVVAALMDGEKAQMVFTDPPYNVRIDGHAGGLGSIKHREFAMACGEMTRAQFTAFLRSSFENLVEHSTDGSIHFVTMDWRHTPEILDAAKGVYDELKNLIV